MDKKECIDKIISDSFNAYKKAEKAIVDTSYLSNEKHRKVFVDTFMDYLTDSAGNFFNSDMNKLDIFQKDGFVRSYSGFSWYDVHNIVDDKKENTNYNDFKYLQYKHISEISKIKE
jgi:hypothetical protein